VQLRARSRSLFDKETTVAIDVKSSDLSEAIENALKGLPNIGDEDVVVDEIPASYGREFQIVFQDALTGKNVKQLSAEGASGSSMLSGGTVSVATVTAGVSDKRFLLNKLPSAPIWTSALTAMPR